MTYPAIKGAHGVQVRYKHDGDYGECGGYAECIKLLWDYAEDLGIELNRTADPTKIAEELFSKVKEMV